MLKKKYSNFIFILIMGFGMSLFMTLIITYINTGMDNEYAQRFFKAWSAVSYTHLTLPTKRIV